jgi:GNAT superfamily N-acetyltransferase
MRKGRVARWLRDARTLPADARAAWRREGMRGAWRELSARTLGRVFTAYHFLVIEKDLADGLETPAPPGVSIERFTGDWKALSAIAGGPRRARFEEATAGGRVCFLAKRGEQPVGYAWLAERMDRAFDPLVLELPPATAYLTDLYVLPAERNTGVGSALVSARLRHACERNLVRTWQIVAPRNQASLRVIEKTTRVPARIVAQARSFHIFGRWRVRLTPVDRAGTSRSLAGAEPARLPDSAR